MLCCGNLQTETILIIERLEFFIYVLTTNIQISEIKSFENHDNAKYMKICRVIQK